MTPSPDSPPPWLHRHAVLLAGSTLALIFAGGLVTSMGAGLAVPDWPTTYGENLFLFPPSKWVGNIFYEHGHRLIAATVGLMTVLLALALWRWEPRRWVRRLGALALLAVGLQGLLGGLTVKFLLPTAVSVLHACLAQAFFCMSLALAVVTSPRWRRFAATAPLRSDGTEAALWKFGVLTAAAVYGQLGLGAILRHTGAGLAIPDFPLAFGRLVPPLDSFSVAIHFAHRLGALVVAAFVLLLLARLFRTADASPLLRRLGVLLGLLLVLQIGLGAATVLTRKAPYPTTLHVATGAALLGASLLLALHAYLEQVPRRATVPGAPAPGPDPMAGVRAVPPRPWNGGILPAPFVESAPSGRGDLTGAEPPAGSSP